MYSAPSRVTWFKPVMIYIINSEPNCKNLYSTPFETHHCNCRNFNFYFIILITMIIRSTECSILYMVVVLELIIMEPWAFGNTELSGIKRAELMISLPCFIPMLKTIWLPKCMLWTNETSRDCILRKFTTTPNSYTPMYSMPHITCHFFRFVCLWLYNQ